MHMFGRIIDDVPCREDDVEESDVEDHAERDKGQVDAEQEPVDELRHLAVVVDLVHLLEGK